MKEPLLRIHNLTVDYITATGPVRAVDHVSLEVMPGEILGLAGESGSGKSTLMHAALRTLGPPAVIRTGEVWLNGVDLLSLSPSALRALRWRQSAVVFQSAMQSLNPVMTVGEQIAEALVTHKKLPRRELKERVLAMLEAVRINDPARVAGLYPHEVSGGMGQRIMIAMMLIPEPDLLIADEPTSALDVSVQAQVLDIIDDLVTGKGMGLILISHDLNLVSRYCDRILVMNSGEIVEQCKASDLHNAQHPYTRGLIAAMPRMNEDRDELPVLDRSTWTTGAGT